MVGSKSGGSGYCYKCLYLRNSSGGMRLNGAEWTGWIFKSIVLSSCYLPDKVVTVTSDTITKLPNCNIILLYDLHYQKNVYKFYVFFFYSQYWYSLTIYNHKSVKSRYSPYLNNSNVWCIYKDYLDYLRQNPRQTRNLK